MCDHYTSLETNPSTGHGPRATTDHPTRLATQTPNSIISYPQAKHTPLHLSYRSCATRLQHAQSKFESDAQVSKRDISTLLRQHTQHRAQASLHRSTNDLTNARIKADEADRTLEIARQKAEKIMSDDRKAQIMNLLERSCDVLAEARVLPNE